MPRKAITTAADLKARCIVSDITGCWRWQGAQNEGHPRLWMFDRVKGLSRVISGPRAAALLGELPLFNGWRAWMTCQRKDCVNPAHVTTGTVAQWGAWMAQHARMKGSPKRRHAVREAWRKKLPQNAAAAQIVRASQATGRELAIQLNLSEQTISKMRTGRAWRDLPGPFDGLGAR